MFHETSKSYQEEPPREKSTRRPDTNFPLRNKHPPKDNRQILNHNKPSRLFTRNHSLENVKTF
jgi:hypothetical protein